MALDICNWKAGEWEAAGVWVGSIAASITVFVAWVQLKGLRKDSRVSGLQVLLILEAEVSSRNKVFTDIATEMNSNPNKLDSLSAPLNIAKEAYFNSLDRLCYFIRKNHLLSPEDWKAEYKTMILGTVNDFEGDFGPDSSFKNVRTVYENWKSE